MLMLLWSDIFIYALVIFIFLIFRYIMATPQSIESWSNMFSKVRFIIAFCVLSLFFFISFIDSIHFYKKIIINGKIQQTNDIYSILDYLLSLRSTTFEVSYSAPFAKYEFVSSIGGQLNKLEYIQTTKLLKVSLIAALKASLISLTYISIVTLFLKRKINLYGKSFKVFALCSTLLLTLFLTSLELSQYYHILGTSKIGQDIFYMCLKSIRTAILIGTLTTIITLPISISLGTLAGYYGGLVDDLIQYIYTTINSIPSVLLISAAILSLQVILNNNLAVMSTMDKRIDARLILLCLILGITSWTSLCRLIRAKTLTLKTFDYVLVAKTLKVPSYKIIWRHIVPNLYSIIFIAVALDFSSLVLAEAVLSYVGVGVDPSSYSWGNMINSSRLEISRDPIVWWPLVSCFVFMTSLVLSANIFADALKNVFEPRDDNA